MYLACISVVLPLVGALHGHPIHWLAHGQLLGPVAISEITCSTASCAAGGSLSSQSCLLGARALSLVPGVVLVVCDEQVLDVRVGYWVACSPRFPLPMGLCCAVGWFLVSVGSVSVPVVFLGVVLWCAADACLLRSLALGSSRALSSLVRCVVAQVPSCP